MKKSGTLSVLTAGIIKENPILVLALGTCPALATTATVSGALGMGLAALSVLLCSNVFISLLRKIIPESMRIPCYIVIIAGFVTVVKMLIQAYFPALYEILGVYLDLITVNCIILGRAELFASKNPVAASALDGIGMGLGFTLALCIIATLREVFGSATFAGIALPFMNDYRISFFKEPPGGLLVFGLLIAAVHVLTRGKAPMKKEFSCSGCHNRGICGTEPCNGKGGDC